MHELALEQRRDLGVRAPWHVGDVTWGLRQHEGREDEWTIRVWKDGERIVGWSWLKGDRALLEFDFRRDRPDLAERVAIHRDVWAPSRVTETSFAGVQASWPYRLSLDCVVEVPDGRFAAYALMWPDDENRVGELEPVGVRDEFRRRGLGAAVCLFALRRLYEEGGRQAIVYCATDAACGMYESIGFRRHATLVGYSR